MNQEAPKEEFFTTHHFDCILWPKQIEHRLKMGLDIP